MEAIWKLFPKLASELLATAADWGYMNVVHRFSKAVLYDAVEERQKLSAWELSS